MLVENCNFLKKKRNKAFQEFCTAYLILYLTEVNVLLVLYKSYLFFSILFIYYFFYLFIYLFNFILIYFILF